MVYRTLFYLLQALAVATLINCFPAATARAEIRTPSIFGNHMVLQQEMPLSVWGSATPGEKITVTLGDRTAIATADDQGKWKATLDPLPASAASPEKPLEMKITGSSGKNELLYTDVQVGEVWLASGQSNMVASSSTKITPEIAKEKRIRFFVIAHNLAKVFPQDDVDGKWVVLSEEPADRRVSSVAFSFAVELQKARNVSVGMIQSAWGGTSIAPWIDLKYIEESPRFKDSAAQVHSTRDNLPKLMEVYKTKTLPDWEERYRKWKEDKTAAAANPTPAATNSPASAPSEISMSEDGDSDSAAAPKSKAQPPQPKSKAATAAAAGPKEPAKPVPPDGSAKMPSCIHNAMVHPLIPYAIRGALWYQGETNTADTQKAMDYAELLPLLIKSLRGKWGQGDFPFLYVQLPAFKNKREWPQLRQSQLQTLSVPNTGMCVALDLNPTDSLHPPNKQEVGHRLFLLARRLAYKETDVVAMGPLFQSIKVEGNKLRLNFTETGSGLTIGEPPVPYRRPADLAVPTDALYGFEVCGTDNQWHVATAKIEENTVLAWSDAVPQPTQVRYAWANYPKSNFYNKEGLPASPFSTAEADKSK